MYSEYINDKKKEDIKIKPSKPSKERKINGDIFAYIIVFGIIFAVIGYVVYMIISNRHYTDQEIETQLVEKAKEYVKTIIPKNKKTTSAGKLTYQQRLFSYSGLAKVRSTSGQPQ